MLRRTQVVDGPPGPPAAENRGPQIRPKKKAKKLAKKTHLNIRKEFPETWLWTEEVVK